MRVIGSAMRLLLLPCALWLAGCGDGAPSAEAICSQQPGLCQATGNGVCREEEEALIRARWQVSQDGLDHSRYQQVVAADALLSCVHDSGAFSLGFNKSQSGLSQQDVMRRLRDERKQLFNDTRMTDDPWMLSYRWLNLKDGRAKQRLLRQLDTLSDQSPEVLIAFAAHFRQRDADKAVEILQPLLHLRAADKYTAQSLALLSAIRMEQRLWPEAYFYAVLARDLGEERINLARVAKESQLSTAERTMIEQQVPEHARALRAASFEFETH